MRLRAYNAAKYVCSQGSIPDPSYLVLRGPIHGVEGEGVKGKEEGKGREPGKSMGQEEKGREMGTEGKGGKLEQGRRLAKAGPDPDRHCSLHSIRVQPISQLGLQILTINFVVNY